MTTLKWRYVVPGLLIAAAVAALAMPKNLAVFPPGAPVLEVVAGLYVVGACAWAIGAALDRTRLVWRLLLIWLPAVPLGADTIWAMRSLEADTGLGLLFLMLPTGIVVVACLAATALAFSADDFMQRG